MSAISCVVTFTEHVSLFLFHGSVTMSVAVAKIFWSLSHAISGHVPLVSGAFDVNVSLPFSFVVPALKIWGGFSFTVIPYISVFAGNPVNVAVYCSPALTVVALRLMLGV